MPPGQPTRIEGNATRPTDAAAAAPETEQRGLKPEDYQAGATHPSKLVNNRVDRFDLPQLSITDSKQQESAFKKGDMNGDGVLELSEIDKRLGEKNLGTQDRRLLAEMRAGHGTLSGLSTGEAGHDRGITRDDMAEHQRRQARPEHTSALQLPAERAKMTEFARGKMSPEQFHSFQTDMAKFEDRMKGNPDEVARTYREVARLLEPKNGTTVDSGKMGALAGDVMHQAADPHSIKQGDRNTCTMASLESRIYTRHPSEAARLVADVATRSQYTTADGSRIQVDKQSVNMYPKHWREAANQDNGRSHASQIFQITAANVFHDSQSGPGGAEMEYRMKVAKNGMVSESLVDRKSGEVIGNHPGITIFDAKGIEDVNQRITGANEPPFVIDMGKARTKEELQQNLDRIGRDNNYPALLGVNMLNPPFRPSNVDLSAGIMPSTPYHMVAIEPGRTRDSIYVNDQFGPDRDREHPLETIYKATKLPAEVLTMRNWGDTVATMFQKADEQMKDKPVDPEVATLLKRTIHEYTPAHIDEVERAYQARTGKPLSEFLSRYLGDEDMKALGYTSRWFSKGWTRG